jgi:hypothetical protein
LRCLWQVWPLLPPLLPWLLLASVLAMVKAGLYDAFNYMGDAAGFQSIFPGYGATNHQGLINIAKKYDPERVFQTLMPGGFKVY